ncbi:hypothetical protein CFB46_26385 [Burkholderia sp. HI2761]|nr:hypothetical protein CFB46_26385 [Burkholderia sp. HI2761]
MIATDARLQIMRRVGATNHRMRRPASLVVAHPRNRSPRVRACVNGIERGWEPYFDRRVQAFGTERARRGAQRSFPL